MIEKIKEGLRMEERKRSNRRSIIISVEEKNEGKGSEYGVREKQA